MKIEMSLPMMAKLINEGVLAPSDIRCLDEQSKQELKQLCLELCKPSQCARCDAQQYCATSFVIDGSTSKSVTFRSEEN